MSACKGCGRDTARVGTHWEGCHEHHPECAAYRAGYLAALDEAAKVISEDASRESGYIRSALISAGLAILALKDAAIAARKP